MILKEQSKVHPGGEVAEHGEKDDVDGEWAHLCEWPDVDSSEVDERY